MDQLLREVWTLGVLSSFNYCSYCGVNSSKEVFPLKALDSNDILFQALLDNFPEILSSFP